MDNQMQLLIADIMLVDMAKANPTMSVVAFDLRHPHLYPELSNYFPMSPVDFTETKVSKVVGKTLPTSETFADSLAHYF
jgi:hypothetical protein